MSLASQQSAIVNLRQYQEQGLIPASVGIGDIDLQYKGEAGALVAELTSVDQNGTFASPVPLICRGAKALQMSYWRTDGDWHSSVTLQNLAAKTNVVEVIISYGDGVYVFDKQIAAGATAMVSINDLQQSQEPDKEGRRLPKEATMGGVNIWSQNLNNGIVMNAMLMNPVTKTCGSCGGNDYVTSYAVSDKAANTQTSLYSGFDPHMVNQGFQIYINVRYSTGSQSGDAPLSTTSGSPSVATASTGYVTPVALGTSNITAGSGLYFTDVACSQPGYLTPSPAAMLTVVPQVNFKEVGFKNDHQLSRYVSGTAGTVVDNPDGTEPTWKSVSNPNHPVAYTKGAILTLFATFGVTPSAPAGTTAKIRVKNGSTVIAKTSAISFSGTQFSVNTITLNQALESTVKTTIPIFTWEISYDGGTSWGSIGLSGPHTMYWTYATPLSPPFTSFANTNPGVDFSPLYDLALENACGYVNGQSSLGTILSLINMGVKNDVYYNPIGGLLPGTHPLETYPNSYQLSCAHNAVLFRGLIRSIGIAGVTQYYFGGLSSTQIRTYLWTSTGDNTVSLQMMSGALDGAVADPHFSYHALVNANGTLYDPSYGIPRSSIPVMETAFMTTPLQSSTSFPSQPNLVTNWPCSH